MAEAKGGEEQVAEVQPGDAHVEKVVEPPEISNWRFRDRVPTRDEVIALLESLPDVLGVRTVDFADYVQGLPGREKEEIERTAKNGRTYAEDVWHDTYTIYMSVAGRVKMAETIAQVNGWWLDFEPEPITSTGTPGLIQNGDGRIVYREYVSMGPYVEGKRDEPMGRKPGMAWVPHSGGKQAKGSNPYEKVETAARGRALGAWGIGVLPGSGIATLEEMLGINTNRAAMEAEAEGGGQQAGNGRRTRDELLEEAKTLAEQVRQMRRITEEEMADKVGSYLSEKLGIKSVYDVEAHEVDWQKVKDGQVQLLINDFSETLRILRAQESPL